MFKKFMLAVIIFAVVVQSSDLNSELNSLFSQNLEGMYNNITWVSEVQSVISLKSGGGFRDINSYVLFGIVKTTTEDRYGDPLDVFDYVIGISMQPLDIIKNRTESIDWLVCNVVIPQYIDYYGNISRQFINNPQNSDLEQEKRYTVKFSFAVSKNEFGVLYELPQRGVSLVAKGGEDYLILTIIPILVRDANIYSVIIMADNKTVEAIDAVKNQMKIFEANNKQ